MKLTTELKQQIASWVNTLNLKGYFHKTYEDITFKELVTVSSNDFQQRISLSIYNQLKQGIVDKVLLEELRRLDNNNEDIEITNEFVKEFDDFLLPIFISKMIEFKEETDNNREIKVYKVLLEVGMNQDPIPFSWSKWVNAADKDFDELEEYVNRIINSINYECSLNLFEKQAYALEAYVKVQKGDLSNSLSKLLS